LPTKFRQFSAPKIPITGYGVLATTGREWQQIWGGNVGGGGGTKQQPAGGRDDAAEDDKEEEPIPSYIIVHWSKERLRAIDPQLSNFSQLRIAS